MSWRDVLAATRWPLLLAAVGASVLPAREAALRSRDNREARRRDRHLARPAVQGCARIADRTWEIERTAVVGQPFELTVWLESRAPDCKARVGLHARGVTLDPPGHFRALTVSGQDGDASWQLTPQRAGPLEVEVQALGTVALLGFMVRPVPLVPSPLAIRVAIACGLLAFTVGIPRWLHNRRRWPDSQEAYADNDQQDRSAGAG